MVLPFILVIHVDDITQVQYGCEQNTAQYFNFSEVSDCVVFYFEILGIPEILL